MTAAPSFDVVVVGGGLAGSALAGALARGGLGVLLVEKEPRFRERIRGELTWPWGVAEARRLGLDAPLARAGAVEIRALRHYHAGEPAVTAWERAEDQVPALGFAHPRLQEALFAWAAEQGAETRRPAKAVRVSPGASPTLTILHDGRETEVRARLIVAADGKRSPARRWTGGESRSDPEHHRLGGALLDGAAIDRTAVNVALSAGEGVVWFAAGSTLTRLYLAANAARVREIGADRSFDALLAYAAERMPPGALVNARQVGPLGFFSNRDTWATRLAGNGVVLIGDAAGAVDPLGAHGTAMLFHDARVLSDLLLATDDWEAAIAEYAERRARAYDVIRADDRWTSLLFEDTDAAAERRETHQRARDADPTLGGFALLQTNGPNGLVADDAARRHFFGENLPRSGAG
jgi:2-polyprenyl-6-methoxyphenol hydroxylase-like FAD-dependent oxidoreductase